MSIQKRKNVIFCTDNSWDSIFEDCSSLMEELEAKEIEAYDEERYFEAFLLQFSFLEWKIRTITEHYAKKLKLNPTSLKILIDETSINRLISYFDFVVSGFVTERSKKNFQVLIDKLREYNHFRNDLLHNCANPKKFKNAIHIDQSLMEAYGEGLAILKLLSQISIGKNRNYSNRT